MFRGILGRVIGDSNEREIRRLQPLVEATNSREAEMERRSGAELRALTGELRSRLSAGATLDTLLPEAFAAVREAAKRTVSMRPFDVQLVGGIVLHQGKVAEMKTGEGKTLVATLPVYLNALSGQGVHLVTVNDYLARRDTLWMGPIYHLLGLSVGLLQQGADQPAYLYDPGYAREPYPGLRPVPRRLAYAADVTYGTNNEFGFDYLRDNLALTLQGRAQRGQAYAIVDEVDNIFVDEARTPLIISGPSGEPVEEYNRFAAIARLLEGGVHYELDEKERSVVLTDDGLAVVERETGIENIYDEANYRFVHYMQQALKAQVLFQEGRDYIRQRKRIVLIDQHTGRLMPNRRLSEGLHQAIEAKEGVPILPRDVTSATITIQNYFRMYKKLAGMSGTAVTESEEFYKIYSLDVLPIPTNRPMVRTDQPDVVYRTEEAKLRAVAREILACHCRGQPVLVGTTSVEMSERLSGRLSGERLQMAALAPRVAYAIRDLEMGREERARLRQVLNLSLESAGPSAWRKLARDAQLDSTPLSADNLAWISDYLGLPDGAETGRALERALREGIPHQVLNAKEHTREASIIARAGEPGSVTIATNMAGRGVDIRLGGELSDEVIGRAHQALLARGLDPYRATSAQMDSAIAEVAPLYSRQREQVLAVGGLHILGTERHEARRIDNQLRGRSGRQGEPGSSRFYLSLEDDLMRRFGRREMLSKLMEQIGDDFPIEHNLVSKTLERAQTSVEGYNFDIRKHLLEYDDVLNRQRESIYGERLRIIQAASVREETVRMLTAQVDEYLGKRDQDPEQMRLVWAGLDDVLPLTIPAPNAPFQGPLAFGGHLTAFPPFSISFLADQLAEQPREEVERVLRELPRRAAQAYRDQVEHSLRDAFQATSDRYEEALERMQALLDEKIDEYLQVVEERQEAVDHRRLVLHLERTYPIKLASPRLLAPASLDELRKSWKAQVEVEFHRLTCSGLIDRTRGRLPGDAASALDRVRPLRLAEGTLAAEIDRVQELADRQALEGRTTPAPERTPASAVRQDQALRVVASVKGSSDLDYGRLDRLVGHALGGRLDDLLGRYLESMPAGSGGKQAEGESARVRMEIERMRETILEGKRGTRQDLLSLLRQLNSWVRLELSDLEQIVDIAVAHEADKWAQRQFLQVEAESQRSPLRGTDWRSIAEHLLTTQFTQRQEYDREHRRRVTWGPRLPLSYLVQAAAEDLDPEELQQALLDTLLAALELRETTWGSQELQRWRRLALPEIDDRTHASLVSFLGERALGEHRQNRLDELPGDLYDAACFAAALPAAEAQPLGALPGAEQALAHLEARFEAALEESPVGGLSQRLQDRIESALRRSGDLDNLEARARLLDQPAREWDRRVQEMVARYLGTRLVDAHGQKSLSELPPVAIEAAQAFFRRQRRFVDEARIQQFLLHGRLADLPPAVRQGALDHLARLRLEAMGKRRLSGLDVATRQQVLDSLQSLGLFTDTTRRAEILGRSLAELPSEVSAGFGACLARELWAAAGSLEALADLASPVLAELQQAGVLDDAETRSSLAARSLDSLGEGVGEEAREQVLSSIREDLVGRTMQELPSDLRDAVHAELVRLDYFLDEEKVGWYERKTLAQLPAEQLLALEKQLGRLAFDDVAHQPFRSLEAETQEQLLRLLDAEGIRPERAERLRLTQVGSLSELSARERERLVPALGRTTLVRIRDRRPAALPEREREAVRAFLRDRGAFSDAFKEELFAYQRLDEFGTLAAAVEEGLLAAVERDLRTRPIGELPERLQTAVRECLVRSGVLLDQSLLRQARGAQPDQLPPALKGAIEQAIGRRLLEEASASAGTALPEGWGLERGLSRVAVAELPAPVQARLWRYLDEIGYFLDAGKRAQVLERRLSDLGPDVLEPLARDYAEQLWLQFGGRPIAELDDELRQGLRAAVEAQGHFDNPEAQAQAQSQPLTVLPRADLEALAAEIGVALLRSWSDARLSERPAGERDAILGHLQDADWFVDRARADQLKVLRLRELAPRLPPGFVEELRREHAGQLARVRLPELDRHSRTAAVQMLFDGGLRLDESQLRSLRARRVDELAPEVLSTLLGFLGSQAIAAWQGPRIQDLRPEQQSLLGAFLGRQIMSLGERRVLLFTISRLWIDYLTDIEDLRRGIGLEAYGQRDPLVEYKRKAFELFEDLTGNVRRTVVRSLFRQTPEPLPVPAL